MNFSNLDVKEYIVKKGFTQKNVAILLGVTPEYFCRFLKNELKDEEKEAIKKAIDVDKTEWQKRHRTYLGG